MTDGNTLNLILKKMLGHFQNIQPLKEILDAKTEKEVTKTIQKRKFQTRN